MNHSERQFASFLEQQGKLYFFEPKKFTLPAPFFSYTPDFYIVEDNAFYEVAGTRQAYSYNKHKYESFIKQYPALKLLFVHPNGDSYNTKSKYKKHSINNSSDKKTLKIFDKLKSNDNLPPRALEVIEYLLEQNLTIPLLAIKLAVPPCSIYSFLHGKTKDVYWLYKFDELKTPQKSKPKNNPIDLQQIIKDRKVITYGLIPDDLSEIDGPKFSYLLKLYINQAGGIPSFSRQCGIPQKTIEKWLTLNSIKEPMYFNSRQAWRLSRTMTSHLGDDAWHIWFRALSIDYPENQRFSAHSGRW